MAAKSKLTDEDKANIDKLISMGQRKDNIAAQLSLPPEQVAMYIKKKPVDPAANASKLMARNKKGGAIVMTESASTRGDDALKAMLNSNPYEGKIHKIKEE